MFRPSVNSHVRSVSGEGEKTVTTTKGWSRYVWSRFWERSLSPSAVGACGVECRPSSSLPSSNFLPGLVVPCLGKDPQAIRRQSSVGDGSVRVGRRRRPGLDESGVWDLSTGKISRLHCSVPARVLRQTFSSLVTYTSVSVPSSEVRHYRGDTLWSVQEKESPESKE